MLAGSEGPMSDLTLEQIAELETRIEDCYAPPWSVRDRWLQNPECSIAHFGAPFGAEFVASLFNAAPQLLAMARRTAEAERTVAELEGQLAEANHRGVEFAVGTSESARASARAFATALAAGIRDITQTIRAEREALLAALDAPPQPGREET